MKQLISNYLREDIILLTPRDLLQLSLANNVNTAPRLPALAPGCLMVLPQSFGNQSQASM